MPLSPMTKMSQSKPDFLWATDHAHHLKTAVGIAGTHEMMPVGSSKLKRSRLTITFGTPMTFAPDASREEIAAQIMEAIRKLLVASG